MFHVELDEEMEMPCRCNCGNWFDLNDGFKSLHSDIVVCKTCSVTEKEDSEREKEIAFLLSEMEDCKYTILDAEEQINECKKRLTELGHKI